MEILRKYYLSPQHETEKAIEDNLSKVNPNSPQYNKLK